MSTTSSESQPDSPRSHEEVLADAVRVLTEAARLTRPVLEPDGDASAAEGRAVWVDSGRREQADWAEFVTLALAGRPGSWEAEGVRNLLTSTVGHDEAHLLEHRTEPVVIKAHVDEIMADQDVWKAYDDATQELDRRYEAIGIPSAPTAEDAAELEPATDEQERQAEALIALEDRLEQLRQQDWTQYGQALKANIEAAARRTGLRVPVVVNLELETYRRTSLGSTYGLSEQLLEEAIEATPLPGNGRGPLERLVEDTSGSQA